MNMTTKYHRLTFTEREEISKGLFAQESFFCIAKRLNREVSTISREVHQQVKRKRSCYSAISGQELANGFIPLAIIDDGVNPSSNPVNFYYHLKYLFTLFIQSLIY